MKSGLPVTPWENELLPPPSLQQLLKAGSGSGPEPLISPPGVPGIITLGVSGYPTFLPVFPAKHWVKMEFSLMMVGESIFTDSISILGPSWGLRAFVGFIILN